MKTNIKTDAFAYSSKVEVVRLNNGKPIISPTSNWWEDGVTYNPTALFLERSPQNDPIIKKLLDINSLDDPRIKDGVVIVHYRARSSKERDTKRPFSRSFSGLAIYTPELKLIHRHKTPAILPEDDENHYDYVGIEDGRLHCFGDTYYYLYCGVGLSPNPRPNWPLKAQICLAKSKDLLKWEKLGPIRGNVNTKENNNKDGVFFPDKINGYYFMLHRPCFDTNYSKHAIALAMSRSIEGTWEDLGILEYAPQNPEIAKHVWAGAGAVPMALGNKRYLVIYHRGHVLKSGEKWYDLHAAIFNFNKFTPAHPHKIIEKQLERLLIPETPHEKCAANWNDGVANVIFTCGCYEYGGDLYILYGGADCCTLAARVNKKTLLDALENAERNNEQRRIGDTGCRR
ncbi:4-O-beta-D-mannosyl-D-glucose phosphorylase [subsurface metagenome]